MSLYLLHRARFLLQAIKSNQWICCPILPPGIAQGLCHTRQSLQDLILVDALTKWCVENIVRSKRSS
jgi:hypothetical protein